MPDKSVAEWAEKSIYLPRGQGTENEFSHPDFEFSPDLPEVLEAIKNPYVRTIILCWASQCGKSLTLLIMHGYRKKHLQTNCLWVLPVETLINRFIKERAIKIYEKSNVGFLPNKKIHGKRKILFINSYTAVGLANSPATLSSDPMPDIVIDEEDENPEFSGGSASPEKLANDRQRNYPHTSKLIRACTPRFEDKGIYAAYLKNKRYELQYPCPKCKKYIPLRFENLKTVNNEKNVDKIRAENLGYFHYECCNVKILDSDRFEFLKTGKWIDLDKTKSVIKIGFHKSALSSNAETWSSIIAEYLDSKDNPAELMNFYNSYLAIPRAVGTKIISSDLLKQLQTDYLLEEIPPEIQILTAGADVGGTEGNEHYYTVILGWGLNGEIWLISLKRIDAINNTGKDHPLIEYWKSWQGGNSAQLISAGIDAGYHTSEVYDLCKKYPFVVPVMGSDNVIAPGGYKITVADPARRYGNKAQGVKLYVLRSDYWQDLFQGYLERGGGSGGGFYHLPENIPAAYYIHLQNEVKKTLFNNKDNRKYDKWVLRHKGAPNHFRDATIYAMARGYILKANLIKEQIRSEETQKSENKNIQSVPRQSLKSRSLPSGGRLGRRN